MTARATARSSATARPSVETSFTALMNKVSRERGFQCASYKPSGLKRRVAVRMRARGVQRYDDYARLLDGDRAEYDRLLATLTIRVTKLFRNWDVFDGIARHVIPALWDHARATVRVWSAGCAAGQEPYSLAILFHQHAARSDAIRRRLSGLHVVGTDIDRSALELARKGEFLESDFADTPRAIRTRYFDQGSPFALDPSVRRLVRFEYGDILRDPPPFAHCDLIVCRNVLIYLDRDSQERMLEKFHAALGKGGVLVLGKVESLLGRTRRLFAPIDGPARIYRKA